MEYPNRHPRRGGKGTGRSQFGIAAGDGDHGERSFLIEQLDDAFVFIWIIEYKISGCDLFLTKLTVEYGDLSQEVPFFKFLHIGHSFKRAFHFTGRRVRADEGRNRLAAGF